MDVALTGEQIAIRDMALAVGQAEIAPHARAWETAGTMPRDLWPKLAELGLGGLYVPDEMGGTGLSRHDATLVFEALAQACPSVAAFLSIHNMGAAMIARHGTPALRANWLDRAVQMDAIVSYCLTEPGSGSDAAALRTRAEPTADGWALTGTKAFISGAGYSDAYIVMARSGGPGAGGISAFLVPAGTPGLSFGALEDKMGWRCQPTRAVHLDNCNIPAENLLGDVGKGFTYAMAGLDGGRINIAACSLGGAQAAFDRTRTYMAERQAFGQRLDQMQALQFRLADMEIGLQSARLMLRHAATLLDAGAPEATTFCAMAKTLCTETGSRVADECLQLHGGYGYLADYGIEKILRDLRVHRILEGTNEIMRLIVARHLKAT